VKKEFFSIKHEPAFGQGQGKPDPSEKTADKPNIEQDEIDSIRDSVLNEPAITGDQKGVYLGEWIQQKRQQCSMAGNLSIAFLAAIVGGPFAILGAFMASSRGWYGILYVVIAAPVIEELLKQSGMIYLLEKKPYRVFATWQFVFSALLSALVFATVENLIYINLYARSADLVSHEAFAYFRWTVCTALHMGCSAIASMGMIRVWKKQLADGRAADLSVAFSYFVVAMAVHGGYNFVALFFDKLFVIK
jgi:RsiW-degrading membrane proteinase PrsW (M82 family)